MYKLNNRGLFQALYSVLMVVATPTFGAPIDDSSPEDIYINDTVPVVVSPSRMPQSIVNAPGAVTVIDRDFIRKTGYRDIARLFRLIPGFQVAREYGHTSVVSYHGSASYFPNRMQVLIDGRSVYSPYYFGGADWGGLPITLDEIERIEILRGSNSATYGSNAFLGVVNIVTRHSAQDPGMTFLFNRGDHGIRDEAFSLGKRVGDLGLRLNGSFNADHDGYPDPSTQSRRNIVTLRGDYRISPTQELTFWIGGNNGRRTYGYAGTPFNFNDVRTLDAQNNFVHARWRYTPSASEEVSFGYYRNKENVTEEWFITPRSNVPRSVLPAIPDSASRDALLDSLCKSLPAIPDPSLLLLASCSLPAAIPADYNRLSTRDNIDIQHYFSPSPDIRIAWGGEARRDWLDSPRLFHNAGTVSTKLARLFANLEWRPNDNLTLNGGASIEKYQSHPVQVAPRFFVNWHVADGHMLRTGISRAYRQPSFVEESGNLGYYNVDGTPIGIGIVSQGKLRPERLTAMELGYIGSSKRLDASLDLRIFRESISDYIATVEGQTPNVLINQALNSPPFFSINWPQTTMINGLEYQIRSHPWRNAEAIFSHTLIRTTGMKNSRPDNVQLMAPRHSAALTLLQRFSDAWSFSTSVMRIGSYQPIESTAVGARTIFDANLAYRIKSKLGSTQVSLTLIDGGSRKKEFQTQGNGVTMPPSIPTRHMYLTVRLEH